MCKSAQNPFNHLSEFSKSFFLFLALHLDSVPWSGSGSNKYGKTSVLLKRHRSFFFAVNLSSLKINFEKNGFKVEAFFTEN